MNTRRKFLRGTLAAAGGLLTIDVPATTSITHTIMQQQPKEPIKGELVREFVVAGHGNFPKVQELLAQEPNLLNATWDWGAGDFESAIGGAGHMGRTDIAEFLLSKGARMDIFVAAMLGKLDIVRATLAAYPDLKLSKGPHGFTLLHHARQAGERSKPVLDFLTGIGAS